MSMWSVVSSRGRGRGREFDIELNLDMYTTADLITSLVDMNRENAYAKLESDYIERFLERNDPELLLGVTKMMQKSHQPDNTRIHFANLDSTSGGTASAGGNGDRYRKSRADGDNVSLASTAMSFSSASMRTTDSLGLDSGVNYVMKNEMVEKDCAAFSAEIEQLRNATKGELRDLTAQVAELRLTNQEAIDTLAEFRDFVMVKGLQADTKRVPLERCLKFFDKWVIHGNGMVEQMRLRTATLRQDIRQMEKALAIKAELSGILLPVDFEQLEIERREFLHTFAEKEQHLLGLKHVTGNVSLALTTQRKLLDKSKAKLSTVQRRTALAKVETERFDKMREAVEDEIEVWQDRVERLKQRRATYAAPSTMDYLQMQIRWNALVREARILARKEKIALIKEKNVMAKLVQFRANEELRQQEHARIVGEARAIQKKGDDVLLPRTERVEQTMQVTSIPKKAEGQEQKKEQGKAKAIDGKKL